MLKGTFIAVVLLLARPLYSQPAFDHITAASGLSSNKVQDVLQDRQGFYWIATSDGLNRFDGSAFKIFRNEKNNEKSLADNHCSRLLEDREGDIWIATYKGISIFSKKDNSFKSLLLSHQGINPDILNRISGLIQDRDGNIWISTIGLWKYDVIKKQLSSFGIRKEEPITLTDRKKIFAITYDSTENGIWFAEDNGIVFFDIASTQFYNRENNPRGWKIFSVDYFTILCHDHDNRLWFYEANRDKLCAFDTRQNALSETSVQNLNHIQSIVADEQNKIWISKYVGRALIYDPVKQTTDSTLFAQNHSRSVLYSSFNSLYIDRHDNFWISSPYGISILNPSRQFYHLYELPALQYAEGDSMAFSISAIAATSSRALWLGTSNGLYYYDLEIRKYKKVGLAKLQRPIRTVYLENDSILWIATRYTVFKYACRTGQIMAEAEFPSSVQAITQNDEGRIWVGTWAGGLYKLDKQARILQHFDSSEVLSSNKFLCLHSKGRDLWMGFNGGEGFGRLDMTTEKFNSYNPRVYEKEGMKSATINTIMVFDSTHLWMGTYGAGIYIWDSQNDIYTHYSQTDGLSGDFVNSLQKDQKGNVWISTSNGIDYFNYRESQIVNLQTGFVFPHDDLVPNSSISTSGHIFFFCVNRVVEIEPERFEFRPAFYPVVISGFRIFENERPFSATDSLIRLSYQQNFFSFEFSALRQNPEEKVKYAYMLEGFDKDWNYAGGRRFASYTNVGDGSYVFKVKASNERGEWNDGYTQVSILIVPPIWKRNWFIVTSITLLIMGFYLFYRYRIGQVKKMFALRTKISQDLHDEVASTLSGIRLYSELAKQQLLQQDTKKAEQSLDVISINASEMTRDMKDIIWTVNPSNDNFGKLLQKLKAYALELARAADISFELSVDDHLPEERLDMRQRRNIFLICKEAIHNSIKYSCAKRLSMKVFRLGHGVRILISDDGTGFDTSGILEGNGLTNMRERANEIGAKLAIDSSGKGTRVEINVRI